MTSDALPPWFERPRPESSAQETLFTRPLDEALADLHVSREELAYWQGMGWVTLTTDEVLSLDPGAENEIRFVRDVVRSGLDAIRR